MHVKLIEGQRMPRMITVPNLHKKEYRELQVGRVVLINFEAAHILIDRGFCEAVDIVEKKGAKKDGTDSTD